MLAWCCLIRQTRARPGFAIAKRASGVTARRKGPKGALRFWVAGRKGKRGACRRSPIEATRMAGSGTCFVLCATFTKKIDDRILYV